MFRFWLTGALFLLVVSALAAIAGYVRLAVLIGSGVLNSIYLALLLAALERTAEAIIRLVLHRPHSPGLNVLRTRTETLRRRLGKVLRNSVVVIWVLV